MLIQRILPTTTHEHALNADYKKDSTRKAVQGRTVEEDILTGNYSHLRISNDDATEFKFKGVLIY